MCDEDEPEMDEEMLTHWIRLYMEARLLLQGHSREHLTQADLDKRVLQQKIFNQVIASI